MALISCPECNRQISDRAAACPHCGCPSSQFGVSSPGQIVQAVNFSNSEEIEAGLRALEKLLIGDDPSPLIDHLGTAHFRSWLASAEQGNPDAQCLVGFSYLAGAGVNESDLDGNNWLRKAVDQGQMIARMLLGAVYLEGNQGTPKDEKRGFELFKATASAGFPRAQFMLGQCYESGTGTPRNIDEALKWYGCAGQAGMKDAQMRLADLYMKGEMIPRDVAQSFYWMHKVAEGGDCSGATRGRPDVR